MILAAVTAALANYYADAMADGGRPVGSVIRYRGATDDDCCSTDESGQVTGSMRLNVARLGTSEAPPSIFPVWGPCRAKAIAEVHVRVMRCWPSAITTAPEVWDATAAELMDDAWILGCSTGRLQNDLGLLDTLCEADLKRLGCQIGGWTVLPIDPAGNCAGNDLVIFVSLAGPCSIVEDSGS